VLAHLAGRLRRNRIRVLAVTKLLWSCPLTTSLRADYDSVTAKFIRTSPHVFTWKNAITCKTVHTALRLAW